MACNFLVEETHVCRASHTRGKESCLLIRHTHDRWRQANQGRSGSLRLTQNSPLWGFCLEFRKTNVNQRFVWKEIISCVF